MVYQDREAKEQAVLSYMRTLAQSCGSYGRLLHAIENAKENFPEDYKEFMDGATKHCGDIVDFVMWYEG